MTDRFDLEQDIMECWSVVNDLELIIKNDPETNRLINSLKIVYQAKFEKLFNTFEKCIWNEKDREQQENLANLLMDVPPDDNPYAETDRDNYMDPTEERPYYAGP